MIAWVYLLNSTTRIALFEGESSHGHLSLTVEAC